MHCWRPASRLNNKISEHISASVTPLHVCLEEQRGPELGSCESSTRKPRVKSGRDNREAKRETRNVDESGSRGAADEIKQSHQSMANTISNMKMTNPIKELVSKRRKRFTEDGFNLDLTYIRDNLIAMGFPAEKLEGVYRNHIDDVVKFLESKHRDHYKIYNLCKERSYDRKKFKERVAIYAFDDHNPPHMELMKPFCDDVHEWLTEDPENVAVVHCKAGKGRTGVMVCCYLLHSGQCLTATEALNYYGTKRTHDRKGVTIPSQRRYVGYYATLVQEGLSYQPVTMILRQIKLEPVPTLNGGQGYLHFVITEASRKSYCSESYEVKKGQTSLCISLEPNFTLSGDVRIEFYNRPKMKKKEKLFHFWFNTFFVRDQLTSESDNGQVPVERSTRALSCDGTAMEMPTIGDRPKARTGSLASLGPAPPSYVLSLDKWNLDDAHKDKHHKLFNPDFKVHLLMNRVAQPVAPTEDTRTNDVQLGMSGQETPSESSEAESSEFDTTGDEDGWESGESTASLLPFKHSTQLRASKGKRSDAPATT